ncbi:MAG TPA: hypothetical protein VJX94_26860, partial [Stellaceae bacterium]|nr:hypothetical protein [Stellaceae bacterium]
LQERGAYKRDYAPGTYRQKLFGCGDRLPDEHPAAAARWIELGTCGPAMPGDGRAGMRPTRHRE